ncbi:MAG: T9SS type A sorting domain-containing protein [Bacteroidia bacterium]
MKKIALLIVTLIFVELADAQITFQKVYGVLGGVGQSVKQTFDGGYIVTGYLTTNSGSFTDVCLIKTDMYGDTVWVKTFGGSDDDVGFTVQQTTDSGYIVSGYTSSFGAGNRDIYLIKTDANGNLLWSKTYGGAGMDNGYDVQQTFDGNFVITGYYGYVYFLLKVNSIGNVVWEKTFTGGGGKSIKQTTDGGFIITGDYLGQIFLTKTDSGGNMIWTKSLGGANYDDRGNSVDQTTDGGYIIGGYSHYDFQTSKYFTYLIKTNANGDTLWTKSFGDATIGIDDGRCYSIKQTIDGGYVIAGQVIGQFLDDVYLLKIDSTGNVQWSKSIGGAIFETGYSVVQTSDSGFIIAGSTNSFASGNHLYLIKTDANGNSGCYDSSFTTIINLYSTSISVPTSSIISPAFVVNSAPTVINAGSDVISVCLNTGINGLTTKNAITIFPNPSTGHFIIELNYFKNYCTIEVYNVIGENIFSESIYNESKEINLKNISRGIYFVKVYDGEKIFTQKIIIQ